VQGVLVQGVVEAVTADVVGRLQRPGERDVRRGHHQRRQHLPLQVGRQAHRRRHPAAGERVGVAGLGDDEIGGQPRDPLGQPPVVVVDLGKGQRQHPDAIGAVEHREEQADAAVGAGHLLPRIRAERGPRRARVDRFGLPDQPRTLQRLEDGVIEVLQVDRDVAAAHLRDLLGDQWPDQPGRHEVGTIEERPEQPLAEALVPRPPGCVGEAESGEISVGPARCIRRRPCVVPRHPSPTARVAATAATRQLFPGRTQKARPGADRCVRGATQAVPAPTD
jgi:hypothetical protein